MLSVIVPAFNAAPTLGRLLASIDRELGERAEIVVVDDASTDDTAAVARAHPGVRLVRLPANGGPGHARNRGVAASSCEALLFLDADVVLCEGFGAALDRARQEAPGAALVGMLALRPAEDHAFARYKAAHMHAYTLAFLRRTQGRHANFTTQCGVVSRALFDAVGGFREEGHITWIEDDELGYRLAERVDIHLCPELLVGHHFDGFAEAVRKIVHQSRLWTHHFLRRRPQFDAVGKTASEAANKLSATAALAGLIGVAAWPHPLALVPSAAAGAVFVATSGGLVRTCWREYGPGFALWALGVHGCVGVAATAGAALGLLPMREA